MQDLENDWMISSPELLIELTSETHPIVLVDVREPEEFHPCSIPSARLIPLGTLAGAALSQLNPQDNIVVYCAHGVRSLHGLQILKRLGFEKVRSLTGGIESWKNHQGPTVPSQS